MGMGVGKNIGCSAEKATSRQRCLTGSGKVSEISKRYQLKYLNNGNPGRIYH